ncbi:ATP10 protein-domain-containing protein [Calycina marina]|uniref:ATP10 protein-domain-containing protein n=1 Tax=Calycina marina TaxID=1763456 RepID=A0A9P7Z653_9HELO|nr:ATP10 protein-domain-containing protein [Calycina marina]
MFLSQRAVAARNIQLDPTACIVCQWRTFSTSYQALVEKKKLSKPVIRAPLLADAPRAYGKIVKEFTPKPLNQPIGLESPPQVWENSGIDTRTRKQKWDDYFDREKHLKKREELTKKFATSYYREWSNMRLHKGKSFVAPPRLFKAEFARYFPNFVGKTLVKESPMRNTTPELQDRISVVSVYSTKWALDQAKTFLLEKNNPQLHEVIRNSDVAQFLQINVEENSFRHAIINLLKPSLRKEVGLENWSRYFVVKRNIPEDHREAIGYLNSKVGYVYLVDAQCRIRWAGSGNAEAGEKEGLVAGVKRLIEEIKTSEKTLRAIPASVEGETY